MKIQSDFVVSPQWLADHLTDPAVVIIDCRFSLADPHQGRQQYEQGHVPGAFYLDLNHDLSSPVQQHGGRHPLPDLEGLAAKLAALGVRLGETLVVAYDASRQGFAARVWWLLRYLGHDRVAVLDGGFPGWQQAGYPVTQVLPTPRSGEFTPQIRADWVVDIEQVKASQTMPGVVLVDSRERDRYLGKVEPIDPIAGHIPGAVNYPWQACTDDQGYLLSAEQLRDRFSPLIEARQILVYCGSGVTACVNLLALELAQIATGKLYAGSWSDWCSYLLEHPNP